jgi:hypothetical protein
MTVREKTGRKRYVHFVDFNSPEIKNIVRILDDSRVVNYKGIRALRVRHDQLPVLRRIAEERKMRIDMVSGTLKALKRKVS